MAFSRAAGWPLVTSCQDGALDDCAGRGQSGVGPGVEGAPAVALHCPITQKLTWHAVSLEVCCTVCPHKSIQLIRFSHHVSHIQADMATSESNDCALIHHEQSSVTWHYLLHESHAMYCLACPTPAASHEMAKCY